MQTLMAEDPVARQRSRKSPWESGRCIDLRATSSPAKRTGLKPSVNLTSRPSHAPSPMARRQVARYRDAPAVEPAALRRKGESRCEVRLCRAGKRKRRPRASPSRRAASAVSAGHAGLRYEDCESYRANGKAPNATFVGEICSLEQPFIVRVDSVTGAWPFHFTPKDGLSGQLTGTYRLMGAHSPAADRTRSLSTKMDRGRSYLPTTRPRHARPEAGRRAPQRN